MRPKLEVATEALRDRQKARVAQAKGRGRLAARLSLEAKFQSDMEKGGFEILHRFCGSELRPSVSVVEEKLQDVIRATRVRVRWTWTQGQKVKIWPDSLAISKAEPAPRLRSIALVPGRR